MAITDVLSIRKGIRSTQKARSKKRERGQKFIFLMNLLDERVKYLNKNALYFLGSKQPLTITLSVRKPI